MSYGTTATVLLEGEADCRALVSGTSEPRGTFINDTSKLSTKYAVIQDSEKYQWFSYEIASRVQRNEYENFVNDIVHPTRFRDVFQYGLERVCCILSGNF